MNNNLSVGLLVLVVCVFSFGAGFLAGKQHERHNRDYFNFRYDPHNGVIIDGRHDRSHRNGDVRVDWPFGGVEVKER